jgi:hypothetical protein
VDVHEGKTFQTQREQAPRGFIITLVNENIPKSSQGLMRVFVVVHISREREVKDVVLEGRIHPRPRNCIVSKPLEAFVCALGVLAPGNRETLGIQFICTH